MKISNETLKIISSIKAINTGAAVQGAVFKKGNKIKARKYNSSAPILYADIPEEFPRDFAVSDLTKFLSMFSLLDDPDLTFDDQYITFKSGKRRAKLRYAAPHLIEKEEFFSQTIRVPDVMFSCELSADNYKTINSAATRMVAPEIAFISDGTGPVYLSTYNTKDEKADRFEIEIGESTRPFKIIVDLGNVKFLDLDYTVSISQRLLLEWKSDNIVYYITASDKSKVN